MLRDELFGEIAGMPAIDVHSHLARDGMAAETLDSLMFYHMLMYPLRAAGFPEEKLWRRRGGKRSDVGRSREDWVKYFPAIAQTNFGRIARMIFRDLYGWDEPVTLESLQRLEEAFQAKVSQPDWPRQVLQKANVVRVCSSQLNVAPLTEGEYDGGIRFTIEQAPASGNRETKPWEGRFASLEKLIGRPVASRDDLYEAVRAYYDRLDWEGKDVLVAWISSQVDFRPVAREVIDGLLRDVASGKEPSVAEGRLLEAALTRAICEANRERIRIFQICYGVQFISDGASHSVCRAGPEFASSMGVLFGEFPDIHFNILNGFEPDEPVWCSMCVAYNNVSLSSYWWMTFYPSVMHNAWARRLDIVPLTNLCAFLSDGWCVDYIYGRLMVTKRVLANVLAEKIERDKWTADEALAAAREILFETPRRLFLPNERIDA
jgi:glucuronate isomerase